MLISDTLARSLSDDGGRECHAAIQDQMNAASYEREALPYLTRAFRLQADEDRTHGAKIIDHVTRAGENLLSVAQDAAGMGASEAEPVGA